MPEDQFTTPRSWQPSTRIYALLAAVLVCLLLIGIVLFLLPDAGLNDSQRAAAAEAASPSSPFDTITLTAKAAFVFDLHTGNVLYEKEADTPRALASLTKMMLALVVSETLAPGDSVPITEKSLSPEGESGLVLGERWRMQDLLDYTLMVSSNDGAFALAEAAGKRTQERYPDAPAGNVEAAIWRMNEKAKELGMTNTYFLDPHGLDESDSMAGAYGSARDMAVLFAYAAMRSGESVAATAYPYAVYTSENGSSLSAQSTNDAIGTIPGLIIGKTGYTDLAGGNLGVVFDAGLARPIAVVVLGSTKEARFSDVQQLAEAARAAIISTKD